MKRTTFDEREEQGGAKEPAVDPAKYGTCWNCGGSTPKATLMDFGAICFPCFKAYCAAPQRPQKLPTRPVQRNWLAQSEETAHG